MLERPWIRLDINPDGDGIRVGLESSEGHRTGTRKLEGVARAELSKLASAVERAATRRDPLPDAARESLVRLTREVLSSSVLTDSVLAKMLESAEPPVLLQVATSEPDLLSFPWEALRTEDGPLCGSGDVAIVRLPRSGDAEDPPDIEVDGALSVLTVAPAQQTDAACEIVHKALSPSEERGAVTWVAPVFGVTGAADLHRRLKDKALDAPHVLHFIGHGDAREGQSPRLEAATGVWIEIDALSPQIRGDFKTVRLVVLETCRGAAPGAFASAAEHLNRAGVGAVVAFLWTIEEDVSEHFFAVFYGELTRAGPSRGDVVAAMEAARAALIGEGATAFSAVLYLRDRRSKLFDFREARRPARRPVAKTDLDPALGHLLSGPFSLVLGASGDQEEIVHLLRREVLSALAQDGDSSLDGLSWSALVERYVWDRGVESFNQLCQQVLREAAQAALERTVGEPNDPVQMLGRALGKRLPAGVHVTLLWQPTLERIAAKHAGQKKVLAVQPSIRSMKDPPSVFQRDPQRGRWSVVKQPDHVGPDDICVLRLLGGLMPTDTFSSPVLTDDDHLVGVLVSPTFRPPWMNPFLASLTSRRVLFVGISALDWHHRLLLRWLFDRSIPDESVAIVPPGKNPGEPIAWERGAGLGGQGRVYVVQRSEAEIAGLLEREPRE